MLLRGEDPAPFEMDGDVGSRSPFVIICDHAGRLLPRGLGTLGLTEAELQTHIAWDIGAGVVARQVASVLDACVIWQRYSRLVIDCNRSPGAPDSIVTRSERTEIPGNHHVTRVDAAAREREVFRPYHDAIGAVLDRRQAAGRPTVVVAMHSFTPSFLDVVRPWHVGVLYEGDVTLAKRLLALLKSEGDLVVGDNQPYAFSDASDHSITHHARRRGLPYAEIEVRQDLIAHASGQEAWAQRLARLLVEALKSLPSEDTPPAPFAATANQPR